MPSDASEQTFAEQPVFTTVHLNDRRLHRATQEAMDDQD
jgi:hypothetical protein